MAKRVILIRHGDLGEACRGVYIGRTDVPLSEGGKRQAAALAGEIGRLDGAHILCSPLLRSRETAEIAIGAVDACDIDSDLREIDFGRWEGMGFTEIAAADDPTAVERWAALDEDFAFPGGESIGDFSKRIGAVARRIAADPAGTVIAFTHGGVIRYLICRFLGLEDRHYLLFDVRPGSVSEVLLDGGRGVLTRLNDRCHLESY
jgi:broad specificity phosphatase PhoE